MLPNATLLGKRLFFEDLHPRYLPETSGLHLTENLAKSGTHLKNNTNQMSQDHSSPTQKSVQNPQNSRRSRTKMRNLAKTL
jgi:hypothetical protein